MQKPVRTAIAAAAFALCTLMSTQAHAGIPVIDVTSIAQQVQQVLAWAKQYTQMIESIQKYQRMIQNASGVRGFANLAMNGPLRDYMPTEYSSMLSDGIGAWESIRNAATNFDFTTSSLNRASGAVKQFENIANQAAINRASADQAYTAATKRFEQLQELMDALNVAPDAKDIQDLQGRIQAEQTMLTNEANKLLSLAQLAAAQRDVMMQQVAGERMQSTVGAMPAW